jgi:nucleoid-associated protein YgaU
MRKDVKLGMAIGGGLIVLLIGYLLFTPPAANNKKGTQLAIGGGNGSIIDSSGPGDLSTGDGPGVKAVNDNPGAGNVSGGNPVTRPTVEPPAPEPAGGNAKPQSKSEVDQWGNTLDKGHIEIPSHAKPKATEHARAPRHETGEGSGTPNQPSPPKLLYNPGDAWGGGVSTDAVFGSSGSAARRGKTDLAANNTGGASSEIPAGGGGTHIVKAGETLSSIALSAYGSANYYPHILRANPNVNPNNLKLGTPLKLPHIDEVKAADHGPAHTAESSAATEVKIDPSKQYRVQAGDSLYKIAVKIYGKSSYLDKIYEKNKALIGADNKRLKLGMILELPEKAPTAAAAPSDSTSSTLTDPSLAEENQAK